MAFGFTISTARTLTYRTGVSSPSAVRYAGFIAAAEGAAALIVAVVLVIRAFDGAEQRIVNGFGTAAWFAVMGAAVLTAGWALVTGRRWGRGIAVFANLLLLPVAWYVIRSQQPAYAIGVGVVALTALTLLFTRSAIRWASRSG